MPQRKYAGFATLWLDLHHADEDNPAHLGGVPTFLVLGIGTQLLATAGLCLVFHRRGWIGDAR